MWIFGTPFVPKFEFKVVTRSRSDKQKRWHLIPIKTELSRVCRVGAFWEKIHNRILLLAPAYHMFACLLPYQVSTSLLSPECLSTSLLWKLFSFRSSLNACWSLAEWPLNACWLPVKCHLNTCWKPSIHFCFCDSPFT